MPPPYKSAPLPESMELVTVSVDPGLIEMPPPSGAEPSAMVSPAMVAVTSTSVLLWTLNTWLTLLPLIVSPPAPRPSMSRFSVICSGPLIADSVMVPVTPLANAMVSPGLALLMVARNDPVPLSLVFRT